MIQITALHLKLKGIIQSLSLLSNIFYGEVAVLIDRHLGLVESNFDGVAAHLKGVDPQNNL